MYLKQTFLMIALGAMAMTAAAQASIDTQRQYLSGHGCDDMVNWDFYCTGGRNAGKWTKIGVPSCWGTPGIRYLSVWYAILWKGYSGRYC